MGHKARRKVKLWFAGGLGGGMLASHEPIVFRPDGGVVFGPVGICGDAARAILGRLLGYREVVCIEFTPREAKL